MDMCMWYNNSTLGCTIWFNLAKEFDVTEEAQEEYDNASNSCPDNMEDSWDLVWRFQYGK